MTYGRTIAWTDASGSHTVKVDGCKSEAEATRRVERAAVHCGWVRPVRRRWWSWVREVGALTWQERMVAAALLLACAGMVVFGVAAVVVEVWRVW